jgi:hypothetical protein
MRRSYHFAMPCEFSLSDEILVSAKNNKFQLLKDRADVRRHFGIPVLLHRLLHLIGFTCVLKRILKALCLAVLKELAIIANFSSHIHYLRLSISIGNASILNAWLYGALHLLQQ